jgi:spore coat polysaccharide biosynthesis protein SpsF
MKIAAFIVARQESSRLPGKAMIDIVGKPMVLRIIEQVRKSKNISEVWIVTSDRPSDTPLAMLGEACGCKVFRGDAEDVLSRISGAAANTSCDFILEVGGDCPFVDAGLIDHGVAVLPNQRFDLFSNALVEPFKSPVGYDFILVSKSAIIRANSEAANLVERRQPFEHILRNQHDYVCKNFTFNENCSHLRWTLDYPEDLLFVRTVFAKLSEASLDCSFENVMHILDLYPEVQNINSRYQESVTTKSIWYTGSYLSESKVDLSETISNAFKADESNDWGRACTYYSKAIESLTDLSLRAQTRLKSR